MTAAGAARLVLTALVLSAAGACSQCPFDESMIHGSVAPGFEEVREEFVRNFTERGELGAACAIFHRGEKVVDLWGGSRDSHTCEPWEQDTMTVVFSASKGVSAMVMAMAHSRGLFELDEPVARYWPEFAQAGKEHITVRQLFAHEAGLSALDEKLSAAQLANLDALAVTLARQAPAWAPGTRHGYHAFTLGWYQSELLRRVDPQHRSIGRFLQDEVARPLGIEMYIGLPADVPASRIASIRVYHPLAMLLHMNTLPPELVLESIWPWSLTALTVMPLKISSISDLDSAEYRAVEIPSANCITSARALARLYSVFATGGSELQIQTRTLQELTAPPRPPSEGSDDLIITVETAYSCGFLKPNRLVHFGTSESAFGTPGAGGSFAFADPDEQIGYAYVMNKMGYHLVDDPREKALRDACYRCLARIHDDSPRQAKQAD